MENKITLVSLVIVLVIVISVGIMVGTFCDSGDQDNRVLQLREHYTVPKKGNDVVDLKLRAAPVSGPLSTSDVCQDCLPDMSYCGHLPSSLTTNQQHSAPKNIVQPYFEQQARGEALMPNYQYYDWGFGTDLKDATYASGQLFMPPAENYIPNYNIWSNPSDPYAANPITINTLENSGFYNANF